MRGPHMPDVEHRIAVYWDALGKRLIIHFEDLADDATFANAKLLELYDESEQVRVFPRDRTRRDGRRHFYSESSGRRALDRGENNPEHDERVFELAQALHTFGDGWRLAYQALAGAEPETIFGPLPAYTWGAEVTRILTADNSLRHDIYGDWGIRMSVRRPSIAIEVVNTHYPEEATFSALLAKSAEVPLVVLFDFTRFVRGRVLVVDEASQSIVFRSYAFSIFEGCVWLGKTPRKDITTSQHLEVAVKKRYEGWT
jgi:hypothetical protein